MYPVVSKWRIELDLKTKSEALKVVREEARNKTSKNRFAANKMLIDRAWELRNPGPPAIKTKSGQKTADKVQEQITASEEDLNRINEDFTRIMALED
jgi:hypothetical protein